MRCACHDPCGLTTAWYIILAALNSKRRYKKRTSFDGVIIEETFDLQMPPKAKKRLSGNASSIKRGSAVTFSELRKLRPYEKATPTTVVFDVDLENYADEAGTASVLNQARAKSPADASTHEEDATTLDDADIESLVSDQEEAG